VWVIVAAAGESRRMGLPDGESKQFLLLGGEPILSHSVRRLLAVPQVAGLVVVLHPSHTVRFAGELFALDDGKPLILAEGGRERGDSVRAGLAEVPGDAKVIAVHDGARPLFSRHVFEDCVRALDDADGAVPAIEVSDTLKRSDDHGAVVDTVDRRSLWAAQTPQVFRAVALRDVYSRPISPARPTTRPCSNEPAAASSSSPRRPPTSRSRLRRTCRWREPCSRGRSRPTYRVGQGIDAHRFAAGRPLVLAGVEVPHPEGLAGHSDADVAVHAIMDALLGAAGLGDIGELFPDSDAAYRGADSVVLLADVTRRVAAAGWHVVNVDLTVVCEAPRLAPHREAMKARLAAALGVTSAAVGVKATTTEGMGFAGRGEGVAALAVCLVSNES
jgi:2-C-methyl-D-erythritol 2,4-cyclodiphosphate synthase/2-C-methyl-D-erythritol 4-phosphate cytidylyltransferase